MIRDAHPDPLAWFGPEDLETRFGTDLDPGNRRIRRALQIFGIEPAAGRTTPP